MSQPLISLLHPTARVRPSEAFPQGWKAAHDVWMERADHPERIEYILTVHESRWTDFCDQEALDQYGDARRDWHGFQAVQNRKRDCVVDQTNLAAQASKGKLLVGVADDYYPPLHWDTLLLEAFECDAEGMFLDKTIDDEVIISCSSGATPERDRELMMAGALTRKRYERYGFILDPDFESMYSDNWFSVVARRDAEAGLVDIVERFDIRFDHRHPSFGKGQMDDIYALQNREQAYQDGAITFKRKMGMKVLAIGLPGQQFSSEWVHGWTSLYGHVLTVRGFLTVPIFLYTSNVHCTRMEFATAVLESKHKPDLVLSIDDDNILEPQQFDMLLQDLEDDPDLAGVVGWCWCDPADARGDKNKPYVASCGRQMGWDAERNENGMGLRCSMFSLKDFERAFASGKKAPHLISSDDLAPDAFWSGLPVILMRRAALETLGAEAFRPMLLPDVRYGFTSEDTSFFYHAHKAGLKFAVDMRVKVPHLKLRAIEVQYLPGVDRREILEAQGRTLGIAPERDREVSVASVAD